jgi:hypothetical protein
MSDPHPSSAKDETQEPSSADKIRTQLLEKLGEAEEATTAANLAKQRADATDDLEEKAVALEEAAKEDKRAKAAMKAANRLQSGVWQGGAGGAGIGAGVGAGLGTVVGSIVGGVAAIPTTGLGLLVGAGTGAVHGPWIKIKGKNKDGEDEIETIEQDENRDTSPEHS